ncbi:NTP transferase domain-containing protein [Halomicroarcula sp. F28]|uniref:sugar phosphate nucleotidyltransferase n=1 Tax=Haloarcula salinisoli TaxID=2487746 RepID=UPI001C7384FD|nr:sugar phosphate nucleotidyltransferase [Halomicroarcula salinisoli]MBX0288124.1 NTP transferase domain-containing protein [Halomicroarcula salinisoli]
MDGVALAAGKGTRMGPLTAARPKALVTVAGQPLLAHGFDALLSLGVSRLVVVVGYRGRDILDHYGDSYRGIPIEYVDQAEQLGTAHALQRAVPVVGAPFVVLHGDNVCRANLQCVVERHRETDAAATLLVESVSREQARTTGVVTTDGDGRVTGLVEKPDDPPSTLVNRGFYAFGPEVEAALDRIEPSARGEYEITDAVDDLRQRGHRVETVELDGWCHNVNEPADRERVAEKLGR